MPGYSAMTRRTTVLLLAALLAISPMGCATSGVNQGDLNLVSIQEEWELGARLAADLETKLQVVHEPRANQVVNQLGRRLVAKTEMANLPWNFHIVADPEINAFNIPGGHVYVTTGLIDAAGDVSAFSSVLAHEIGHGVSRHATEQLTRAYGLQIVASLLLGENPALYEQILAQLIGQGTLARHSRSAEKEADLLGVRYLHEASFDPSGMLRMFQVLLDDGRRTPGRVEQLFATHPLTEDRIEYVRVEVAKYPGRPSLVEEEQSYRRLQNLVGP